MAQLARLSQFAQLAAHAALAAAFATTLPAQAQEAKAGADVGCPSGTAAKPAKPAERAPDKARATAPAQRPAPAAEAVDYEREVWRHQGVG